MLKKSLVLLSVLCSSTVCSTVGFAGDAAVFDMGYELTAKSDYMDSGLTNSDHKPSVSLTLSPSYGIFYGTIYGANIDYGVPDPKLETKFAVGATPVFGPLAVDFNLARRIKFDDPTADRWLPYVTGTYTFNDNFNVSLGAGDYLYDDPSKVDYYEIYAGATVTLTQGATFVAEYYLEPDSDGANNSYQEFIGTVTVPFAEKFEASAKLGYEAYEDDISTPSYAWYELGAKYKFNDHVAVGVAYHGNNLSSTDCPSQAYTDCDSSVFATLTVKGNLSDIKK